MKNKTFEYNISIIDDRKITLNCFFFYKKKQLIYKMDSKRIKHSIELAVSIKTIFQIIDFRDEMKYVNSLYLYLRCYKLILNVYSLENNHKSMMLSFKDLYYTTFNANIY